MDGVRDLPSECQDPTLGQHSKRTPKQGASFVCQRDKFISFGACCRIVSAADMGKGCMEQGIHQRGRLADLARFLERLFSVSACSLGEAKKPQSPGPIGQRCDPHVLAKSNSQRTMLGGFVDRDRLIVMGPTFRKCPRTHQGRTHKTMPEHEWNRCSPLLGKRQAFCRKVEESIAVEPYIVRDPEPVED